MPGADREQRYEFERVAIRGARQGSIVCKRLA